MFDVKVLSREDTEQLLDIADVISVVEDVYRQKAGGQTVVWPMVFMSLTPVRPIWISNLDGSKEAGSSG